MEFLEVRREDGKVDPYYRASVCKRFTIARYRGATKNERTYIAWHTCSPLPRLLGVFPTYEAAIACCDREAERMPPVEQQEAA